MTIATPAPLPAVSSTTPLADSLRVTVRARAGRFHKEVDVSLPSESSLDEVLGEVTELLGAPTLTRPWRASTAAGRPLDHSVPLSRLPLADGAVVLLRPLTNVPAPVVRDAAEALAAAARTAPVAWVDTAWATAGLVAAAGAGGWFFSWPAALAVAAVVAVAVHVHARNSRALGPVAVLLAAAAAFTFIGQWQLGLLGAAATACAAVGVLHVGGLAGPRLGGAVCALSCAAACGGVAALLLSSAPVRTAGAAAIVTVLIVCAAGPGLATRAAGLRVPRLPTAGEDLAVADIDQPDVESRAVRAHALYHGMLWGAAGAALGALAALAWSVPSQGAAGFTQAACLCVTGALVLHAARHGGAGAVWPLHVVSIAAFVTAASAAAAATATAAVGSAGDTPWPLWVAPGLVAAAAVSSPVWSRLVKNMEPTALVWVERLEMLCLACALPLAAHLMGIFHFIRGLG